MAHSWRLILESASRSEPNTKYQLTAGIRQPVFATMTKKPGAIACSGLLIQCDPEDQAE
ncbi:MAG: hypothetical protein ABJL35_07650 [Parasphingorhabdus sp.]|uniref:hypothetical protein n=1 Tax=Parasphingorhabdus sp. TaxID=2709688 RepID=UPI003299BD20